MKELQRTGIKGLDELIGGIPRASRTLLYGPPGSGKTVFAMQFLWKGLQSGETVSYQTHDRPWPHVRSYFDTFGWDVTEFEKDGHLLPLQGFPHFDIHEKDPLVTYCQDDDFSAMQAAQMDLAAKGVTRFVSGDRSEHAFSQMAEEQGMLLEQWMVSWCHHNRIASMDIINQAETCESGSNHATSMALALANNVIRFRTHEKDGSFQREMRIEKLEGVSHPLSWMPFQITGGGMEMWTVIED